MPKLLRTAAVLASLLVLGASGTARAAQTSTRKTRTVYAIERVTDSVVHLATEQMVRPAARDAFDDASDAYYALQGYGGDAGGLHPLGSGTLIDPSGYVITSYRVISRGSRLHVIIGGSQDYVARVVGTEPETDLALLKIDGATFPYALMQASDDVMLGETAIAMGNPLPKTRTATVGVVSGAHRTVRIGPRTYHDLLETDADIDPGNAGGPLVNGDGEVMGVITGLSSGGRTGFAVPIQRAKRVALDLIRNASGKQAYFGLDVQTVTGAIAQSLGVDTKDGASIVALEPHSPAAFAGLKVGDVITSVQDQPVRDADDLLYDLRDVGVGQQAVLQVDRGGDQRNVTLTAVAFPLKRAEALFARKIGAAVAEVSGYAAQRLQIASASAVAVRVVRRGSAAEAAGLAPGDVIRAVNSVEVTRLADFRVAVAHARRSGIAVLLVQRGFQLEEIPLDFY